MDERRAVVVEEQDRPAVAAERLERMFDGLRYEVGALRMPPSDEVVLRAVRRRRRRRAELAALTGALTSVGVWGLTSFCGPVDVTGPAAGLVGLPAERTIAPTLLLPGPVEQRISVDSVMPLSESGAGLLLGVDRLPRREDRYGPWGPFLSGSSAFAMPAVQGCVPRIAEGLGASRQWRLVSRDQDAGLAVQYLLEFDAVGEAADAEQRLLAAAGCTEPGDGWVSGERTHLAVALRTYGVSTGDGSGTTDRSEEVAVRVSGRQVAVLLVQYTADPTPTGVAGAVLDPEFRVASEEFAGLSGSVPPPA
ncbi:hypothetical protein ACIRBX_14180 [Kitasatospora sp. NPDC096147]|uniref:hypothetical protein n=1 Tax=Kitasatospora sp. NPDC096147 TaxID=3364093 RepID=UPI0038186450